MEAPRGAEVFARSAAGVGEKVEDECAAGASGSGERGPGAIEDGLCIGLLEGVERAGEGEDVRTLGADEAFEELLVGCEVGVDEAGLFEVVALGAGAGVLDHLDEAVHPDVAAVLDAERVEEGEQVGPAATDVGDDAAGEVEALSDDLEASALELGRAPEQGVEGRALTFDSLAVWVQRRVRIGGHLGG